MHDEFYGLLIDLTKGEFVLRETRENGGIERAENVLTTDTVIDKANFGICAVRVFEDINGLTCLQIKRVEDIVPSAQKR